MASTSVDPHTPSSPAYAREERVRPTHIGRVYFVGVLLMLFVGYLAYCLIGYGERNFQTSDQKRVQEREKILADRQAEDAKLLKDDAGWFKKDKGLIRVPIATAMEMTVTELSKVKPHASDVPVTALAPGAAPAAGQATPPAAQPAAPAPAPVAPAATAPAPTVAPAPAAPATSPTPAAPVVTPVPATPTPVPAPSTPVPTPMPAPTASAATPANVPQPAAPVPAASASPASTIDPSQPGVTPGGTPR